MNIEEYKEKLFEQFNKIYNPAIHGHYKEAKEQYENNVSKACEEENVLELMDIGLNNELLEGINKEFVKIFSFQV